MLLVLAVAALVTAVCSSGFAQSNGPGVVYSYEKVQLGDTTQWVLVPSTMRSSLSGDLETDVRASFKALRNAKPPTYGGTTLNIKPNELSKGRLGVRIDPKQAAYALIIEAEVVATLAPLGISEVAFSGAVEETLSLNDLPFAVFAITVPVWRALPPVDLHAAQVRLPDGSMMSASAFAAKVEEGDRAAREAVYSSLSEGQPLARSGILARLPELGLEDWEDEALERLKDDEPMVREAAVRALGKSKDGDVLDALVAAVDSDSDPSVQAAAAEALSKSGNKKYSAYGTYFALRGDDRDAALAAIDELVQKGVTDAADELAKALAHPHRDVAKRAAEALRKLGRAAQLIAALENDELPGAVREHAAVQLSRMSDSDAKHAGRAWLAAQGSKELALTAVESLAAQSDPEPHDALRAALDSPHRTVRAAAARAIASLGETDSLDALAAAIDAHPEQTVEIERAMVSLLESAESLSELEDRTKKERNDKILRATYQALGRKAADAGRFGAVRDKLTKGIESGSALAKGGALIGLAHEKTDESLALISQHAEDPTAQLRRDVALALGIYPPGKATDVLLSLARDDDPMVAVAAIHAFGRRGEVVVAKDLTKLGKESPEIRIALTEALPKLVDADTREDIVGHISNLLFDDDRAVKLAAIEALGAIQNDAQAVTSLAMLVQDPDKQIQFAAFEALGASQHPEAVSLIAKGLESSDIETRRAALEALRVHGGPGAKAAVEGHVETESDPELKALAESVLADLS